MAASSPDLERDSLEKPLFVPEIVDRELKNLGARSEIDDRELKILGANVENRTGFDVAVGEICGDSVRVKEEEGLDEDLVEDKREEEIELELVKEEERLVDFDGSFEENIEIEGVVEEKIGGDEREGFFSDEDEWEGIERSELEKLFGAASTFVGSGNGDVLAKFDSDVQMQLYGLYKIATEGPCYEHQPLALKVSTRAKWHAWQQLGKMNPEEAMEQYVTLLSDRIPGWMGRIPGGNSKQEEGNNSPEARVSETKSPNISSFVHDQLGSENERKPEDVHPCSEGGKPVNDRKSFKQGPPMTDDFSTTCSLQPQGHY
eukprot:TRINITY_DN26718_c0_g1_i1.p1 TRINITY_DN26718_c0_g1~~TRINITY_DN26718_c0_g1_i1.p1  ORF type:complete len:356 (-),score=101.00 TRINITY_DN26718_c0_g1_i1:239-1189(-)